MKKITCIILIFVMVFLLFACGKADVTEESTTTSEQLEKNIYPTAAVLAIQEVCSVPLAPTGVDNLMLQAAYREMSKGFEGAIVKNHEELQLGEIGGQLCMRFLIKTDKGDFVAVVNEDCEVIDTWSDGEKKTVEYWFPQMWDVTVASDENLSIAYHNFKSGGYHDEAVIYDYRQTYESRDGKFLSKVELFSTCCVSTFWIDEAGRIIDRTK